MILPAVYPQPRSLKGLKDVSRSHRAQYPQSPSSISLLPSFWPNSRHASVHSGFLLARRG